jgi:glycolate oxidase iron-sulfur subunit
MTDLVPPASGVPVPPLAGGAFDLHHPPDRDLVADCVHCGFCLPACPTYVLWGEEMDSPRGRITLIKNGLDGEPLTPSMVEHVDRCLGCMACVTACPSGVQYDRLIEPARAQVERQHRRPLGQRLLRSVIFGLFPYPRRLSWVRPLLRGYQRSGVAALARRLGAWQRLPVMMQVMEEIAPVLGPARRLPERVPAVGPRRAVVGLLTGCIQGAFFPEVNAATARVLAAEGCDVVIPRGQGCCGALSAHNGREAEAISFARGVIAAFEAAGVDWIVVNAAGCGSTMKTYAHLLRDDPAAGRAAAMADRVRDLSEFLAELGPVARRHRLPMRIAYQDACHLAHAQGIRAQPRSLLRGIPGLELVEIADPDLCCGSAGIYNLLEPLPARELGSRKAASVLAATPDLLVTANPGCLMQIGAALRRSGVTIAAAHTAEVLDASIRGTTAASFLGAHGSAAAEVMAEVDGNRTRQPKQT